MSVKEERINVDLDIQNILNPMIKNSKEDSFLYIRSSDEGDTIDTHITLHDPSEDMNLVHSLVHCMEDDERVRLFICKAFLYYISRNEQVKEGFKEFFLDDE